jgi:hypothetical protein
VTDYSGQGAVPVDDAAVDEPPTVDQVLERQRQEHPEQAASAWKRHDDDDKQDEPDDQAY